MSALNQNGCSVPDRSGTYNHSDDDASRFREYRRLPSRKKENRDVCLEETPHVSVRLMCYQLSRDLNGSVHWRLSLETHEWTVYNRQRRYNVNSGKCHKCG